LWGPGLLGHQLHHLFDCGSNVFTCMQPIDSTTIIITSSLLIQHVLYMLLLAVENSVTV
jgi:hypothetical protein